jgi:hypothetical protein
VLTRASNMSIRDCSMGGVGSYRGSLNPAHWLIFRDNGGAHCNAEAFVQGAGAIRLGAFLEGANGFFKQNQRNGVLASGGFKICAINRPAGLNGPCTGRFSMLMDDFGLASGSNLGGNEGSQCPSIIYGLPCVGGNMPFWTATNLAYAASSLLLNTQSSDYETFMQVIFLGDKPSNHSIVPWIPFISTPVSFHMGFTGEDSPLLPFSAFTPWASDPILFSWYWEGSPFAMPFGVPAIAYLNRDGQCYLGRKCADLP